jgi:lactose/L-arabinose transport system ATP-binding protein
MVFQSYALYPTMSVRSNMEFGLRMRGKPMAEIRPLVEEKARMLHIDHLLDRRPSQLSGGQRQRVAIGRAIVRQPEVFLFDEPLSNLDAELRVSMRVEIARLHRELGNTMIYVTHDQTEAMTLADVIVVLRDGRVEQAGSPRTVYENPNNAFVAGFIGSPRMNLLDAVWRGDGKVELAGRMEDAPITGAGLVPGDKVTFGLRPEHLVVGAPGGIEAHVDVLEYLGGTRYLYCQLTDGQPLIVEYRDGPDVRSGDTIALGCPHERRYVFNESGFRIR